MSFRNWLLTVVLAFLSYFVSYQLISKPLTDGEVARLMTEKSSLLEKKTSPRLVILAGSNGRFSHSCAVMMTSVDRVCINASLMAGLGLDYVFHTYIPLLQSGDVVYIPYEYEQYAQNKDLAFSGPENAILWRTDRATLIALGWERTLRASFYADGKYLLHGVVEMALNDRGFKRRFDEASINSQGDQTGHTKNFGESYVEFLKAKKVIIPIIQPETSPTYSSRLIANFLKEAKAKNIKIIGGLPTTFSDVPIPTETREELKAFYIRNGQYFLELPNLSQYPRSCFFDMPYHLNQECQRVHSLQLADALKPYLKQ